MSRILAITPEVLVRAYGQGVFPMARSRRGPVDWYSPDPRAVLPLEPPDAFHVPHSLGRRVRSGRYRVTFDACFEAVMRACAAPRQAQEQTWISEELVRAYCGLHRLGLAHSVEAWEGESSEEGGAKGEGRTEKGEERGAWSVEPVAVEPALAEPGERHGHGVAAAGEGAGGGGGRLVGGLYGVALGGAFFGESMFSRASDASKVCLVHLVEHLRRRGYALLDVQLSNPHLEQFGVIEIPRAEYLRRLAAALGHAVTWGPGFAGGG